ncbi:MAG: hypothetical protein C4K49_06555 [Candidatus Thorarchaeota archaeon]|nr:MAG: hypothetical protein C4K49_06555 [Candidatus Thorarchaeota archaeon]
MSVKERRRQKERSKPRSESKHQEGAVDTEASIESFVTSEQVESPLETPETTQVAEPEPQVSEPVTEEALVPQVLLPRWGDNKESEWMYQIPPRDEDRDMWMNEWADFVIQWTQSKGLHVLSVSAFIKEPPFRDMLGKVDAFRLIGNALVDKGVAEWLDDKKRQLRVYWRPLEEWADLVYGWAIETGNLHLDVKSIIIQEASREFASLPERDLHQVMEMLVDRKVAEWVDRKRGAILIRV